MKSNIRKRIFFLLIVFPFLQQMAFAQKVKGKETQTPKIIVGMMVDQMRWDYLYKYKARYGIGGINRLIREGFSCENTMIKHAPTVTACGHASVYTGSVPAINGIAGNDWYDREWKRFISNVEDSTSKAVGSKSTYSKSPNNLLVTTIGDELRLATQFQSKVVSVSIKDRGAILPGGHTANGAFWNNGNKFVTSSYYMEQLPDWAIKFNETDWQKKLMPNGWNTLYPINTYKLSNEDDKEYENSFKDEEKPVFPHTKAGLTGTPFGNTFTLEFAKRAIEGYKLGQGVYTGMLAVSLSSPDGIGHQFGTTSVEVEDNYLRLDKDLEDFFIYLDKKFGKDGYIYFITADHGGNQSPGFLQENKLPTGALSDKLVKDLNAVLEKKFERPKLVIAFANGQLYLNYEEMEKGNLKRDDLVSFIAKELKKERGVLYVFDNEKLSGATIPEPAKSMFINGYNAKRSGDILVVKSAGWKIGSMKGTSHSDWNPYDSHIPLVWMGKGIKPGKTNRTIGMTDIAPTVAAMLQIQMPSGCIGEVITEITDNK